MRTASWLPSEAHSLLIHACVIEDDRWMPFWERWRAGQAAEAPDALSRKLLPLIYWKMGAASIDDPLLKIAQTEYLETLAHNLQRDDRLGEVLRALAGEGIQTTLLKGAAMTAVHYPSRGLRDMGDVDLLVAKTDVARAIDVMQSLGWSIDGGLSRDDVAGEIRVRHAWSLSVGRRHNIDLHWRPLAYCYSDVVDRMLAGAANNTSVANAPTRVLAPTDQLFHTCVHGSQLSWAPAIRWIVDAMMVLRGHGGPIDWDRFGELAALTHMTLRVEPALRCLRDVFGASIPEHVFERLAAARVPAWERRDAALQASRPPLSFLEVFQWHWCHFRRLQPHDTKWRRMPAPLAFAAYLRAWGRVDSANRLTRFVDRRVGPRRERPS